MIPPAAAAAAADNFQNGIVQLRTASRLPPLIIGGIQLDRAITSIAHC